METGNKIEVHLDGKDFEGFGWRMLVVLGIAFLIKWLFELDGGLVFFLTAICWIVFFFYKIMHFKEVAYRQIINDLEEKNARLEKGNKLLQNVIQDQTGMKVDIKDKSGDKD